MYVNYIVLDFFFFLHLIIFKKVFFQNDYCLLILITYTSHYIMNVISSV